MLGPWIKAFGSGQTGDDKSEIKILGIKELKWTGMGDFNSDDHYIYYCGQESVHFSSVAQSCPTLCDPMNRSTPGLPVHHQLPEFTQTHVHQVRDAIQPSHLLLSPSPPASNRSQHQNCFQWVNSLHEVAKVQYLDAISKMTEWPLFVSKANHSISW